MARRRRRIRSKRLTAKERRLSATAERRIIENLRYAAVLEQLRGASIRVERVREFEGPLPGIYVSKARRPTSK